MSIPDPTPSSAAPAGWYPTGEAGPDGLPVERWWDGAQWSAMVRPVGGGAAANRRSNRTKSLIAAAVVVVLVGGGLGSYFALHNSNSNPTNTAQNSPTTGNGGGNGNGDGGGGNGGLGGGNGDGGGNGGLGGESSPSPQPTVNGGSGQTVSDPIDGLTIPVPTGWTGTSGSAGGQGSWPSLGTGPYTCPSALTSSNGGSGGATSSAPECTRGGVSFETVSGSAAQQLATSAIATLAKGNYGDLKSHSVVNQGAITVAGRSGYQITWKVVPSYSGPGGTVEAIAVPVPGQSGYFTLIDIGVDDSAQAPTLGSVNSQIIGNISDASAAGA